MSKREANEKKSTLWERCQDLIMEIREDIAIKIKAKKLIRQYRKQQKIKEKAYLKEITLSVAQNMKDYGIATDIIVKSTKLTKEEVDALKS